MYFDYDKAKDGDMQVFVVSNNKFSKNQANTAEGFGYGDLSFVQCDKEQNWDPINKKCCHKSCDPVSCTGPMLWQCNLVLDNNCAPKATLKQC